MEPIKLQRQNRDHGRTRKPEARRLLAETLEPRILYSAAPATAPPEAGLSVEGPPETMDVAAAVSAPPAEPIENPAPDGELSPASPPSPEGTAAAETPVAQTEPALEVEEVLLPEGEATAGDPIESLALPDLIEAGEAAKTRWIETGLSEAQTAALNTIEYRIGDLPPNRVGVTEGNIITIDINAAEHGWFIDETPLEDEEFTQTGETTFVADLRTGAALDIDLVTVVMHEQGHILGLLDESVYDQDESLMYAYISDGQRRVAQEDQAEGALPGSVEGKAFLMVSIFDADFSMEGDGFQDHTTSSPPSDGPASVDGGTSTSPEGRWVVSYQAAPGTDSTANEFSVNSGVMRIQDWGNQSGRFESFSIDVSSISTVNISAVGMTIGDGVQNATAEYFEYFYTLDGGTDVTTAVALSGDTSGTAVNYSVTNLDVSGASTLTVGFNFQVDGAGDGYEISAFTVEEVVPNAAPGVTVSETQGSTDVVEGGTSDTFEVVLDSVPSRDVTITITPTNAETTLSATNATGAGTQADPLVLTFTPADGTTPQTVTVTAIDDGDDKGVHSDSLTFAVASSDSSYDGVAVSSLSVNITDNDAAAVASDLILTAVFDGPLAGGTPKGVEIYVINDVADLSIYGIGSANNGGGSDGREFMLSGSASAGDYIQVASESAEFSNFFGYSPTFTSSAANINGDDAIELFKNGTVVDVFGDINKDGTGEAWDYEDGWAVRKTGSVPGGSSFVPGEWSFSRPDALDGATTNATAGKPVPLGSFGPPVGTSNPAPPASGAGGGESSIAGTLTGQSGRNPGSNPPAAGSSGGTTVRIPVDGNVGGDGSLNLQGLANAFRNLGSPASQGLQVFGGFRVDFSQSASPGGEAHPLLTPYFAGAGQPGSSISIAIRNSSNNVIGITTSTIDFGGNFTAAFPGISLGADFYTIEIQITPPGNGEAPFSTAFVSQFNGALQWRTYSAEEGDLYGELLELVPA